jgi:hypothetical protein
MLCEDKVRGASPSRLAITDAASTPTYFFKEKVMIKSLYHMIFGTEPKFMVRASDPITSYEAAVLVDATKLEQLVYETIAKYPNGCIADEVEADLNYIKANSISPRFAQLIRKGFVEDTGDKRKAASGRYQRVMKVVK